MKKWITHNEPWCTSMLGYQEGRHAPGLKDYRAALAASHHVLLSHGLAVPSIRAESPGAEVGITLNLTPGEPASPSAADHDAARHFDGYFNRWFLDPLFGHHYPADMVADHLAAGHLPPEGFTVVQPGDLKRISVRCDFLGVNYYTRAVLRSGKVPEAENEPRKVFVAPEEEWTGMGWEVYPDGLREILLRVHLDYRPCKLYVTENGASDATPPGADGRVRDEKRLTFLRDHFTAARRAMEGGAPVAGGSSRRTRCQYPEPSRCPSAKTPDMSKPSKDYKTRAQELVSQMTLEEKALLLSGNGPWATHKIERLGIPSIFMADGPHGLRKALGQDLTESVPATCFPTASALASSWDTELLTQVGATLGRESQASDVQLLLGPGINMKRSPLGGRNFEYFSEDPVLAGHLAASYIKGLQHEGVGASLKHFAVNNQEFERMVSSSNLDERTLREIYLPAFEIAITQAQPWSVMCAYNKVNGVYASENHLLLEEILREEWGFEGFVVSDWGAVHDRVKGVMAGLNLEMPGSGEVNRKKIIEAVNMGQLPVSRLDEVVASLLAGILKAAESRRPGAHFDVEQHHALARQAAAESIILLKNDDNLLPLEAGRKQKIALIGAFAKEPRYQGAGSSQVNPARLSNAYDELLALLGASERITYASGYDLEGVTTAPWLEEAQQRAREAEVAIIFAGLPDSHESEGFDRSTLDLPEGHERLIDVVSQVQPNTVVVLMNGSAITMPWVDRVKAILEAWLPGQAGGGAIADILTGRVNPSAKLPETFPLRLEDTPTSTEFPGLDQQASYGEGVFTGYRYYDKKNITPLFPFGFGLSYTTFVYSELALGAPSIKDTGSLAVQLKVKNAGRVAGKEIVQLYLREDMPVVSRPEKELKAFTKVALEPGEEKTVSFTLKPRDFAYYSTALHQWSINPGRFAILAGGSSRNLPLRKHVLVEPAQVAVPALTRGSLVKEFKDHPKGKAFYSRLVNVIMGEAPEEPSGVKRTPREERARKKAEMSTRVFANDMPVYKLIAFSEGRFTEQLLSDILAQVQ